MFTGTSGVSEAVISVEPPASLSPAGQCRAAAKAYADAASRLGLKPGSAVLRRFFISAACPRGAEGLFRLGPGEGPAAVRRVPQPPLSGAALSLLAFHVQGPGASAPGKFRLRGGGLGMRRGELLHAWSMPPAGLRAGPGKLTGLLLAGLERELEGAGTSVARGCLRTWFYLKDMDGDYPAMVEARRRFFAARGLTRATHFIASTGIGCESGPPVSLEAYSVAGLRRGQVSYPNDFSRLCRAADYNVTFERAALVRYADRAHLFVSGTASIDARGRVLHPGDPVRQLKRTLGNIEALLRAGGASYAHLSCLTLYLADTSHFPLLRQLLRERFPRLPLAAVKGRVCRPGWLVEADCQAVFPLSSPKLPSF